MSSRPLAKPPPDEIPFYLPNKTTILLKVVPDSQKRSGYAIICDLCQQDFVYYSNGSLNNITRHRGLERCRNRANQLQREREKALEDERLDHIDQDEISHQVSVLGLESEPCSDQESLLTPESESEPDHAEPLLRLASGTSSFSDICKGVIVQWSHPVSTHYPFHLHCATSGITIDWNPISFRDNEHIFVSKKEEEDLGISQEQTMAYREEFEIQNSSDVEEVVEKNAIDPAGSWKH
ncbi:hypothetical protein H0H92_011746, partial [Tricholoma furcatifolium]